MRGAVSMALAYNQVRATCGMWGLFKTSDTIVKLDISKSDTLVKCSSPCRVTLNSEPMPS